MLRQQRQSSLCEQDFQSALVSGKHLALCSASALFCFFRNPAVSLHWDASTAAFAVHVVLASSSLGGFPADRKAQDQWKYFCSACRRRLVLLGDDPAQATNALLKKQQGNPTNEWFF